jgi:hypothetical protein
MAKRKEGTPSELRKLIVNIIGVDGVSEEDLKDTSIRIIQSFMKYGSINPATTPASNNDYYHNFVNPSENERLLEPLPNDVTNYIFCLLSSESLFHAVQVSKVKMIGDDDIPIQISNILTLEGWYAACLPHIKRLLASKLETGISIPKTVDYIIDPDDKERGYVNKIINV